MVSLNKSNYQSDFFPLLKVMQAGQVNFFSKTFVTPNDMNYCLHHLTLPIMNIEFLRNILQKSVEFMSKRGMKLPQL